MRARPKRGWIGVMLLLGAVVSGLARPGLAQPADTLHLAARHVTRFDDARALAADPAGRLYVADAGRDVVVRLTPAGQVDATLGGPGASEGQFDEPTDIDPTNGLVLVVADAGNGRLQRFSHEGRFLEAWPVPAATDLETAMPPARAYRPADTAVDAPTAGRPVAVVSSALDDTFVIDEIQGHVLMWDESRRLVQVIGGFGAGPGALHRPVALAADAQALYVADAGRHAIVVYDLRGQYLTTFAAGQARDVRGLSTGRGRVWVVLPGVIRVYDPQGMLRRSIVVPTDAPLRDVAVVGERLWVLTDTGLYETFLPE